jgi:uncharacterized membrane protein YfcA
MGDVGAAALVFCAVVIVVAFAVRGTTGFGGGAIAVPLMALALPLQTVVPVVTVLNLLASVGHGVRDWRRIDWKELLRIVPFVVIGVGTGLYLLNELDPRLLGKGLGIFVIVYAIFAFATAARPQHAPRALLWPMAVVLGTAAGVIGALFGGAAGPLYAIHFSALHLERDVFRVTVAMVLMFQGALRIAGYTTLGFYDTETLLVLAVALPFMLLGGRLGDVVTRRIPPQAFNRMVGIVLLVSGVALIVK